ncbi:hypothetical protein ACWDAZ_36120, partial [Streptomyces sp. NPDC001215]
SVAIMSVSYVLFSYATVTGFGYDVHKLGGLTLWPLSTAAALEEESKVIASAVSSQPGHFSDRLIRPCRISSSRCLWAAATRVANDGTTSGRTGCPVWTTNFLLPFVPSSSAGRPRATGPPFGSRR